MLNLSQGVNDIVVDKDARIKTAVILAAGIGSRLLPLTRDTPKCLCVVGGETILSRLVNNLRLQGITRLVVVTGHQSHKIHEFFNQASFELRVDYVFNPVFQTTNNIYSLWLVKQVVQEAFLVVESDLGV